MARSPQAIRKRPRGRWCGWRWACRRTCCSRPWRRPRIVMAAMAMAAAIWFALRFLPAAGLAQAMALAALIVGGIAIYGVLLLLFGVTGWVRRLTRSGATRATCAAKIPVANDA